MLAAYSLYIKKSMFNHDVTRWDWFTSKLKAIEEPNRVSGLRTKIFYCDAGKSYQKGVIEVTMNCCPV